MSHQNLDYNERKRTLKSNKQLLKQKTTSRKHSSKIQEDINLTKHIFKEEETKPNNLSINNDIILKEEGKKVSTYIINLIDQTSNIELDDSPIIKNTRSKSKKSSQSRKTEQNLPFLKIPDHLSRRIIRSKTNSFKVDPLDLQQKGSIITKTNDSIPTNAFIVSTNEQLITGSNNNNNNNINNVNNLDQIIIDPNAHANRKRISLRESLFGNPLDEQTIMNNVTIEVNTQIRHLAKTKNVYDSLSDEEIELQENNKGFVLKPDNPLVITWNYIVVLCILYTILVNPVLLIIYDQETNFIFGFNLFLDCVYLVDVVSRFFLAFIDFEENLITNMTKIAINYLLTWFLIDLVVAIPFNFLGIFIVNQIQSYILLKFFAILKLYRYSLRDFKMEFIDDNSNMSSSYKRLFIFLIYFLFANHIIACIWVFLGNNHYPNWINRLFNHDSVASGDLYIAALYFNLSTIFTIGYGDISPVNSVEVIYTIFLLMIGILAYTFTISSISNIFQQRDQKTEKYLSAVKFLNDLRIDYNINENLYSKIKRFLRYEYKNTKIDKFQFLRSLPNSLRNLIVTNVFSELIENFKFFKRDNIDFNSRVIMAFKPMKVYRGDLVIRENDFIDELIFVRRGIFTIESNYKGFTIKIIELRRYEHFGEVYMLLNQKSPISMRTKSKYADIYILKKIDLIELSLDFPKVFSEIYRKSTFNMLTIKRIIRTQKNFIFYNLIRNNYHNNENILMNESSYTTDNNIHHNNATPPKYQNIPIDVINEESIEEDEESSYNIYIDPMNQRSHKIESSKIKQRLYLSLRDRSNKDIVLSQPTSVNSNKKPKHFTYNNIFMNIHYNNNIYINKLSSKSESGKLSKNNTNGGIDEEEKVTEKWLSEEESEFDIEVEDQQNIDNNNNDDDGKNKVKEKEKENEQENLEDDDLTINISQYNNNTNQQSKRISKNDDNLLNITSNKDLSLGDSFRSHQKEKRNSFRQREHTGKTLAYLSEGNTTQVSKFSNNSLNKNNADTKIFNKSINVNKISNKSMINLKGTELQDKPFPRTQQHLNYNKELSFNKRRSLGNYHHRTSHFLIHNHHQGPKAENKQRRSTQIITDMISKNLETSKKNMKEPKEFYAGFFNNILKEKEKSDIEKSSLKKLDQILKIIKKENKNT